MIRMSQTEPAKPEPVKRNVAQQPIVTPRNVTPIKSVTPVTVTRAEFDALKAEVAELRRFLVGQSPTLAAEPKSRAAYMREYRASKKQGA